LATGINRPAPLSDCLAAIASFSHCRHCGWRSAGIGLFNHNAASPAAAQNIGILVMDYPDPDSHCTKPVAHLKNSTTIIAGKFTFA
jgi:hypothetical protein